MRSGIAGSRLATFSRYTTSPLYNELITRTNTLSSGCAFANCTVSYHTSWPSSPERFDCPAFPTLVSFTEVRFATVSGVSNGAAAGASFTACPSLTFATTLTLLMRVLSWWMFGTAPPK